MGDRTQRQPSGLGAILKRSSWVLLTAQSTAFVLLLHYSRIMPPAGGKRYLTSTTVFLNEVVKLAISLTMALYEVSKSAPPSMPATSLFFSLTSAVFSGDSWKLVIPACLYTLSNSLQYIALSNMQSATFQVTFQVKLLATAVFGLALLRRTMPLRKWGILVIIVLGVALVQMPVGKTDELQLQEEATHLNFPRSLEEWNEVKGWGRGTNRKRSATYEGIEEDMLTAFPKMNPVFGLLATIGACIASGLAGVFFEKVLKESTTSRSLWVRNVQMAIYSIFPALFIGVVFLDGEKVAANGFFQGYNWAVWSVTVLQALGGILAAFCISYANKVPKSTASIASIVCTVFGSVMLFDFEANGYFLAGTAAVLAATHLYGDPTTCSIQSKHARPPPIRIDAHEKDTSGEGGSPVSPSPNDFSIKLPTTPFLSEAGRSSSRPASPGHPRVSSMRSVSGGYFSKA